MKFSVCIDSVFSATAQAEAMQLVKDAGYSGYEFWGWWDKDIQPMLDAQQKLGLTPAAFCTRMISLVDKSQREDYLKGLEETLELAGKFGCKTLITQVGNELDNISREEQRKSLVDGLKACIPLLEKSSVVLTFEPLNLTDHAGYYLYSSHEAFSIAREIDSPYIKVLYDIYHQQITEGNVIKQIEENIDLIGHMHAAGNPGRHEITTGELHYKNIFDAVKKAGYKGYMGLEYFPAGDAVKGLKEALTCGA